MLSKSIDTARGVKKDGGVPGFQVSAGGNTEVEIGYIKKGAIPPWALRKLLRERKLD